MVSAYVRACSSGTMMRRQSSGRVVSRSRWQDMLESDPLTPTARDLRARSIIRSPRMEKRPQLAGIVGGHWSWGHAGSPLGKGTGKTWQSRECSWSIEGARTRVWRKQLGAPSRLKLKVFVSRRLHSPGAIALLGVGRSAICWPNRLPISSTAVRAVRPRSSRNGLSSTMSTDPTTPESCRSSMIRCASR
jgi:hypothetical protein